MTRFSNGFYTFSDSYFKNMRKQDLINYIRTIEKNWENQLITNDIQYSNCKRLLAEERNKTIDETCLKIFNHLLSEIEWNRVLVDDWDALAEEFKEIAEQMKGGGNDA